MLKTPIRLGRFSPVVLRVAAVGAKIDNFDNLRVRIKDEAGETFQFDSRRRGFSSNFEFDLAPDKIRDAWGGDKNRIINGESRIIGFSVGMKNPVTAGDFWFGDFQVLDLNGPGIAFSFSGTDALSVLRSDCQEQFRLNFRNNSVGPRVFDVKCRFEDFWKNHFLIEKRLELASGETATVPLGRPFPSIGHWRVECEVRTNHGTSVFSRSLAVMTPSGPTRGRAKGFLFGVHSHPQRWNARDKRLEAYAAGLAGIKVLRADAQWRSIQPKSPLQWDFRDFDETVAIYEAQGIEIATLLGAPPTWAKSPDWKPLHPNFNGEFLPRTDAYCEYLRRVAERYRGRVRFYEQLNEPDLAAFNNFSAEEYVALFNAGSTALRNGDPAARLLTGGFATMRVLPASNAPDYIEKALKGMSGRFDIHAHHEHGTFDRYKRLIDGPFLALRRKLGVTAPWYANETAVNSVGGREKEQAADLWRKLIFSWSRGAIGYNWYDLRNDGFDPDNGEHNYGLLTHDFQPKMAFVAYNTLTGLLKEQRFQRQIPVRDGIWLFAFDNGARQLLAGFGEEGASSRLLLLETDATEAEAIDIMGNRHSVAIRNGVLAFEIGAVPSMLRIASKAKIQYRGIFADVSVPSRIVPGKSFEVTLSAQTTGAEPVAIEWLLEAPAGISFSSKQITANIPGGAQRQWRIRGFADRNLRLPDEGRSALKIRYRSGMYDGCLNCPLESVITIPAKEFHREPDFRLSRRSQNVNLVGANPASNHLLWRGIDDLSASIWLARVGDRLVVSCEVVDDIHRQPYAGEAIWKGDSIQFAILPPGKRKAWEFGLAHLDSGESSVYIWHVPEGGDAAAVNRTIRLQTRREGGKTFYRAEISLAALGLPVDEAKNGFYFNLLVNDNDGEGREGWMQIAPGLGGTRNLERYPLLQFEL